MKRQAVLLHVIAALHSAGRLAGRLDRGKEETDHHADDRDHHQQFDQSKTLALGLSLHLRNSSNGSKNNNVKRLADCPKLFRGSPA
jgi:hypothetical protein